MHRAPFHHLRTEVRKFTKRTLDSCQLVEKPIFMIERLHIYIYIYIYIYEYIIISWNKKAYFSKFKELFGPDLVHSSRNVVVSCLKFCWSGTSIMSFLCILHWWHTRLHWNPTERFNHSLDSCQSDLQTYSMIHIMAKEINDHGDQKQRKYNQDIE